MRHNAAPPPSIFYPMLNTVVLEDSYRANPEAAGMSAPALKRLSEVVHADVDAGAIPGAVIWISRNDTLAYFEAIGFAERSTQRAMQLDSIFRIASMTKP